MFQFLFLSSQNHKMNRLQIFYISAEKVWLFTVYIFPCPTHSFDFHLSHTTKSSVLNQLWRSSEFTLADRAASLLDSFELC